MSISAVHLNPVSKWRGRHAPWTICGVLAQPHLSITRRAVFHPWRCYFARLTSGKSRYVPIRPRYERICTQKHTARQSACSQNDLERPQWRALRAAAAVVVGKPLIKLRARVRTYKGSENSSQWERDPMHAIRQWSRTPECDPKKFPTELKNTKTGNFLWIAFWRSTHLWENVHWLAFPVKDFYSARKGPHPRPQFY